VQAPRAQTLDQVDLPGCLSDRAQELLPGNWLKSLLNNWSHTRKTLYPISLLYIRTNKELTLPLMLISPNAELILPSKTTSETINPPGSPKQSFFMPLKLTKYLLSSYLIVIDQPVMPSA
jgi:hypothetical protein